LYPAIFSYDRRRRRLAHLEEEEEEAPEASVMVMPVAIIATESFMM
jgi:hypothetical protein